MPDKEAVQPGAISAILSAILSAMYADFLMGAHSPTMTRTVWYAAGLCRWKIWRTMSFSLPSLSKLWEFAVSQGFLVEELRQLWLELNDKQVCLKAHWQTTVVFSSSLLINEIDGYKFNLLHCKHVFLIDAKLSSNPVVKSRCRHSSQSECAFSIQNCTEGTASFVDRLAWYFKKCWDSYTPRKREFPQPISRGNLFWWRMFWTE